MHRYALVSGVFLALMACVHLLRLIRGWPVTVAGIAIPPWPSAVAVLVAGGMALWAFRVNARDSSAGAV
jgi:hypothetical protein